MTTGAAAGQLEVLWRGVGSLPPFPVAAAKVLELIGANAEIHDVAAALETDAALAASVLARANSARHRGQESARSVREAAHRLGPKLVATTTVLASSGRYFRAGSDLDPRAADYLWYAALVQALAGEYAAERAAGVATASAYTAGLLADISRLVVFRALPHAVASIRAGVLAGEDACAAEARVLGVDHAELSARMLEEWHLPRALVDAVRHHHADGAAAATDPALARVAAEGARLAAATILASTAQAEWQWLVTPRPEAASLRKAVAEVVQRLRATTEMLDG